jgi:hypothetical protein
MWPRSKKQTYELLSGLFQEGVANDAFYDLFPRFLKGARGYSLVQDDYSVRLRWDAVGYDEDGLYWDSYFGIVLEHDLQPVAMIGFNPKGRTIIVSQLQGVQGCAKELRDFFWERLLVVLLIELARKIACRQICMIRAHESDWYDKRANAGEPAFVTDEEQKTHADRIARRYDGTARKLRFSKTPRGKYWTFKI